MIRIEVKPVETESTLSIEAHVTNGREEFALWWTSNGYPLAQSGDPFVLAALPSSLEAGVPIHCDAPVSDATRRWAKAWAQRHGIPASEVQIEAPTSAPLDQGDHPLGSGAFFTAGAISNAFVTRHHRTLTHLVHVHGFSLPLHDIDGRRSVSENVTAAAHRWELNTIELTTNLRTWSDPRHAWFGGYREIALVAAEAALSPTLEWCATPGKPHPTPLLAQGSFGNRVTPTGSLGQKPDAAEIDRIAAVGQVASDRDALHSLWVCDDPRNHGSNCGQCQRCVETMVLLQAEGVLDHCPAFRSRLDLHRLRRLVPSHPRTRETFAAALERLQVRGTDPLLAGVLRAVLETSGRRPGLSALWPVRFGKVAARA